MNLLIIGDRHWKSYNSIWRKVATLPSKPALIITGANINKGKLSYSGADGIALQVAKDMHIPYKLFYADWDRYPNNAGPIRNQEMVDEGKPDFVLAFHSDITKSRGTADCLARVKKAGIPFEVVTG